ncbi:MAG: bifunctional nuclease family protein [Nitriliruptoraceae bacterium]
MIEMELIGVRVELPANQPIVLLKEREGSRYLPIWIGAVEATAIAFALQGVQAPRPLTHDLFVEVIHELGAELASIHVTELRDKTFFAELRMAIDGRTVVVSARPSDAIALASRLKDIPIYSDEDVLAVAGLELEDVEGDMSSGADAEEEVRQFREFLDDITPDDFKS